MSTCKISTSGQMSAKEVSSGVVFSTGEQMSFGTFFHWGHNVLGANGLESVLIFS